MYIIYNIANVMVSGSAIIKSSNWSETISEMKLKCGAK